MISKLRERPDGTLTAEGPRFRLERVLEAGASLLRTMLGRAAMRFPGGPIGPFSAQDTLLALPDGASLEDAIEAFRKAGRRWHAADLHVSVPIGPLVAAWAPLGFDALCGASSNCVNSYEADWSELDPTPLLYLLNREHPHSDIGREALAFLKPILGDGSPGSFDVSYVETFRDGVSLVDVRFPHDAFGDGRGRLSILRRDSDGLAWSPP